MNRDETSVLVAAGPQSDHRSAVRYRPIRPLARTIGASWCQL